MSHAGKLSALLVGIAVTAAAAAAPGQPGQPGQPVLVQDGVERVLPAAAEDPPEDPAFRLSMVGPIEDGGRVTIHAYFDRPPRPGKPVPEGETPPPPPGPPHVYLGNGESLTDSPVRVDQGVIRQDGLDGYFNLTGLAGFAADDAIRVFFSDDGVVEVEESIEFGRLGELTAR